MKRVIAAMAAGGVLVAGAFVASTLSSGVATAQTTDTTAGSVDPDADPAIGPREEVLDEILASLVEDGTLSSDQAAAVKDRFIAKHDELLADRRERREATQSIREQIRAFLGDDVISAEELAQLPESHPLRDASGPFGDALADGQITRDELRDVAMARREIRHERRDAWLGIDA